MGCEDGSSADVFRWMRQEGNGEVIADKSCMF